MYPEQNSVTYRNKTEIPSQNRLQFFVSAVRFHECLETSVKSRGIGNRTADYCDRSRVPNIYSLPLLNCYSNPGAVKSSGSRWGESIFFKYWFLTPFFFAPVPKLRSFGIGISCSFHIAHSLDVLLTFVNGLGTSGVRKNMPLSVARYDGICRFIRTLFCVMCIIIIICCPHLLLAGWSSNKSKFTARGLAIVNLASRLLVTT